MGTLWLHMGQAKTGTSALQVFFARNKLAFWRQDSAYPWGDKAVAGTTTAGNGAWLARWPERFPGRMAALEERLASGRGMVLSSEFFAEISEERIRRLQEICSDLRALVYLREPADMIVSHYYNKLDRRRRIDQTLAEYAQQYVALPHLRHGSWLQWLSSVLGPGKLVVRSYAQARSDLTRSAVEAMSFDVSRFDHDLPRVNATAPLPPVDSGVVAMLRDTTRLETEQAARDWFPGQAVSDVYHFRAFG